MQKVLSYEYVVFGKWNKSKGPDPNPVSGALRSSSSCYKDYYPRPPTCITAASSGANPLKRETVNHFKVLQVFGFIYSSQYASQTSPETSLFNFNKKINYVEFKNSETFYTFD